jgi:hypothetical protein
LTVITQTPKADCAGTRTAPGGLKACVARKPSPMGNIVIDAGQDDSWAGKRHYNHADIHEGKNSLAVALMTRAKLMECFGIPPERIRLTRFPGETQFGQYANASAARKIYTGGRIQDEASTSTGDGTARSRHIQELLGSSKAERDKGIVLSIHHNAAKADYPAVLIPAAKYGNNSARQEDLNFAHTLLTELLTDFDPTYKRIASGLPKSDRFHTDTANRNPTPTTVRQLDSAKNDQVGGLMGRRLSIFSGAYRQNRKTVYALAEGTFMDRKIAADTQAEINRINAAIAKAKKEGNDAEYKALYDANHTVTTVRKWNATKKEWEVKSSYGYKAPSALRFYANAMSEGLAKQVQKKCNQSLENMT